MRRLIVIGCTVATGLFAAAIATGPAGLFQTATAAAGTDGPALLVGTVTSAGEPDDAATVKVSLFPVAPARGFKPGATVDLLELPPVAAAADGSYVILAPTARDLRGYVDQWGRVNMTVLVDDGTLVTSHTESTAVPADVPTTTARSRYAHRAPAAPATFDVDLGDGTVHETMGQPGSETRTATVARVADFDAAQSEFARKHPCTKTFGKKHYDKRERFMYVNNWVGAKAKITQGSGTTHTLGIGMKLAGKGWSASGDYTSSVSTSNQATRGNVVDRWIRNSVNTQDVHYRGLCEYPGQRTERRTYSIHTLIDGVSIRPTLPEMDSPAGCQRRGRDYGYTKDSTSNMTVSGGLDLSTVKVSALSGWDRETSFTIDVDKATKECWSNAEGPEHSRYVHYRAWKRTEPCGRDAAPASDPSRCRANRRDTGGAARSGR